MAILQRMYLDRKSASFIGNYLGRSRSAVCGKIYRLRDQGRIRRPVELIEQDINADVGERIRPKLLVIPSLEKDDD